MPYNFINTEGVVVADTTDVLATVQDVWRAAFGVGLNVNAETPQGRIIELQTLERKNIMNVIAFMCNQINPKYSTGVFLDAIGGFFDIERISETYTEVLFVQLRGQAGTVIPAGSQAESTSGDIFALSDAVTLDATGTGLGTFVAVEAGPIVCPANTLNKIITTIVGWETVNNGSNGIIGALTEPDTKFRVRIDKSKFKWSTNMVRSIASALYEINGLKSLYIYENFDGVDYTTSNDPIIPVGETVKAHSVMIVVAGGTNDGTFDQQVGDAILEKRSGGCGMSKVADPTYVRDVIVRDGTYQTPYTMSFNMSAPKAIRISLEVKNISFTGSNLGDAIKNILLNWFSDNLEGVDGVQIGQSISIFDVTSILSSQIGVYIRSCQIGVVGGDLGVNEINVPFTQIATLDYNNITVSVL